MDKITFIPGGLTEIARENKLGEVTVGVLLGVAASLWTLYGVKPEGKSEWQQLLQELHDLPVL